MKLENGSLIDQYKFISSIGKGGMSGVLFDGGSLLNLSAATRVSTICCDE